MTAPMLRCNIAANRWRAGVSATSMPATYRRMAAALSTMSRRRRAGFSEGREPLPVDGMLKKLALDRLFDHVHRTAEDLSQLFA